MDKRYLYLALFTFIFYTIIAENIYSANNIPLTVQISYSREQGTTIRGYDLNLKIIGVDKKNINIKIDSAYRFKVDTLIHKGKYSLEFTFKHDFSSDTIRYSFEAIGNEKNILVYIRFSDDSTKSDVPQFFVVKRLPAPQGLSLEPENISFGSEPTFTINNNTDKVLWGYSIFNYFWGDIYELIDGKWKQANVNSHCAQYNRNKKPVLSGMQDTASIIPSYFSSDRFNLIHPGKYKFSLLVSERKYDLFGWRVTGKTEFDTRIIYEVEKEFTFN